MPRRPTPLRVGQTKRPAPRWNRPSDRETNPDSSLGCRQGSAAIPAAATLSTIPLSARSVNMVNRSSCGSGAMEPPWSVGFKMPANRHPGRRLIGTGMRSVSHPAGAPRQLKMPDPRTLLTHLAAMVRHLAASRPTRRKPAACPGVFLFRRRRQLIEVGKYAKRWAPLPLNCLEPTFARPLPNRRSRPSPDIRQPLGNVRDFQKGLMSEAER